MVLAIAAAVLCAYIAPSAAGSGIPEVKAYLNGIDAHSILAPSTLFVKVSHSLSVLHSLSLSLSQHILEYVFVHMSTLDKLQAFLYVVSLSFINELWTIQIQLLKFCIMV